MAARRKPKILPKGAKIAEVPGLNYSMINAMFAHPSAFVSMCQILREDESIGYLNPTPTQLKLLDAVHRNRWVIVNKYRQAKITTISVMLLLRDCQYLEGVKGLLIAERQDTAEDIFERILFAYRRLPDSVRMPLVPGRRAGTTQMHFIHGGGIKVLTAGGRSPAIGRSIDRLVLTEFGEALWQSKAAVNIFPTVNKRPNARVILESTPGRAGSHHEQMWLSALEKKGRFRPLFLKWWEDQSCRIDPTGFQPTPAEAKYLAAHKGMDLGNLAFRRQALETEMVGDPRLFSSKYPGDPYDGWLGSANPVMPADALRKLLEGAVSDPPTNRIGVHAFEHSRIGSRYMITADPAGFGGSGDNSALIVWDALERRDVAFWEGREDPGKFAARLLRAQKQYNNALLAVESHAAAVIAILRDRGTKNLLWTDRNHPGWYATNKRVQEAEARVVQMLRQEELNIRSKRVLHQLLHYDGSRKKRVRQTEGTTHHFDLARTTVMAADILSRRRFTRDTIATPENSYTPGIVTINDLDQYKDRAKREARSPYKPMSNRW